MIEEYIDNLAKYIDKEKIVKQGKGKYFINSDLVLLGSIDKLPIYLVEIENNVYFIDFGYTLEDIKLSGNDAQFLMQKLKKFDINLEDNSLSMKTSKDLIYVNYNIFIMAIMYLQMYCK